MAEYKSQQINRGSISDILELLKGFSSGHERAKQNIETSQGNVMKLIKSAQTPEQIANAQQALRNISGDSSRYVESSLGHQVLSNVLTNKDVAYKNYNEGLENTVKYIEDAEFLDSKAEFMDLKSMANVMIEDENGELVGRYESVGALLRDKYNSVNALIAQVESGKEYGFRKDQIGSGITEGKTYSQQELTATLTTQKDRLDTAMQAALINGEINEEEAAMIMSGATPQVYENEKQRILRENEGLISANVGRINKMDSLELKLFQDKSHMLSQDDMSILSNMQGDYQNKVTGEIEPMTLDAFILQGNDGIEQALKIIQNEKQDFMDENKIRYQTHEFWAGSPYAGDPSLALKGEVEQADFVNLITGETTDKPAYFNSEKYGQLKEQKEMDIVEEAAIFEDLDKKIKESSNTDLMNRYGTTDPAKIKEIILEKEEQTALVKEQAEKLRKDAPEIIPASEIKREKEFIIPKLEKDPSMKIPEDVLDLPFKDIMGSLIENKEAKAIEYYKLDGFKSSIGSILNSDGSRLSADELLSKYGGDVSKLREKLIAAKKDRKLKGVPTSEQNKLIKSIVKDAALIKKLLSPEHYDYEKSKDIIDGIKKRMEESYNILMDDFIGNLNQKTISKIKDKYTSKK